VIVVFCVSNVLSRVLQTRTISQAVRAKLIAEGIIGEDAYVVVAGPANTYSHYIATLEEYGVQRYEGASTIYGQCEYGYLSIFWKEVIQIYEDTLDAYIDKYTSLVSYLADNATGTPVSDAPPPEQTSHAISLQVNGSPTHSIRGSN
jgi:neutral ceramidase